jgi:hypothetical protein
MRDSLKSRQSAILYYIALVAVCAHFLSCKEEEPSPVQLFELEVRDSYPSASSDNWVIASNMQGDPLAVSFFESGETVVLTGHEPADGLINITLVIFTPAPKSANDRDYYFFNTYTDVPVGDKWYLKRSPPLGTQTAGKVDIQIANLPGNNSDLSISSFNRRNEVTGSWSGTTFNVQVGLRSSPSDLFFSVVDATPRFLKIDAGAGQTLSYDYQTDFKPFDNLIPLTFSVNNLVVNIQGFNGPVASSQTTDLNYQTQSIYTGASTGVQVGFNNGYGFYQTSWNATFPGGRRVAYYKLGDSPAVGSFDPRPALDFEVTDTRFASIAFDISPEFDYCINEYFAADEISDNKPVTTWQIARPTSSFKLPLNRFPDEMIATNPYLSSVSFIVNYSRSTFVSSIADGEYSHYLDERFRSGEFKLFPRETYSLTKP